VDLWVYCLTLTKEKARYKFYIRVCLVHKPYIFYIETSVSLVSVSDENSHLVAR
jgi:hypothetical protein